MATTKLANLINPEVLSAFIESKLVDAIKLSPLAVVGTELQAEGAGNTLTRPVISYIGDAVDLAEGEADTPVLLQHTSTQVTVKKAVKSIQITDEAMLSGYGTIENQIANQLLTALASKVEADSFACLKAIKEEMTQEVTEINGDAIADAMVKFGEDLDEAMYFFISPKDYANVRKHADFVHINGSSEFVIGGTVGYVHNAAVIVSNRVEQGTAYIVKNGALGIELKRDTFTESARDITTKSTIFSVDKHYIAYLRDESKAIKVVLES